MRISNAIHINELIFLLLVTYLKTSTAWAKGKYFSDNEYPEIQMLFSSKEETEAKDLSKNERAKDNREFLLPGADENSHLQDDSMKNPENNERLKPWMRGPFVNEDKLDQSEGSLESYSVKPQSPPDDGTLEVKNVPLVQPSMNSGIEKSISQASEKLRINVFPNHNNDIYNEKRADADTDTLINRQNKNEVDNQNQMIPINESKKAAKFSSGKSELTDDLDYLNYPRKNVYHEITRSRGANKQFRKKNKFNEQNFSGALKSPDFEGNFQEYEEVANEKNERVFLNENMVSSSVANLYKMVSKNEGVKPANKKMEGNYGPMMQAINMVTRSLPIVQPKATLGIVINKKVGSFLDLTTSLVLSGQEKNNIAQSTPSKTAVDAPLQQNSQLLAKPPIKIANTFIEKHAEDENENLAVVEHGTQLFKMVTFNTIKPHLTDERKTAPPSSQNGILLAQDHQHIENNKLIQSRQDNIHKSKRNINEGHDEEDEDINSDVIIPSETKKSSKEEFYKGPPAMKRDLHSEEESSSSKLSDAQFYSLSQTSSPDARISSFVSKLKPNQLYKKEYKDGSWKRNVPKAFQDQEYEAEYEDYSKQGSKRGFPLQSYAYDQYDTYYYNNNDYPGVDQFSKITELTAGKEVNDYSDQGHFGNVHLQKNRKKIKKQNFQKVNKNYNDIFAHPISLDDPELQIVRSEDIEMDDRRQHHKNYVTKRRKLNMPHENENENIAHDQPLKGQESLEEVLPIRKPRKKKGEFPLHSGHSNYVKIMN